MAFGDAQGCYHTVVSKKGVCKKCGKKVREPDNSKPQDKES